MQVDCVLNSVVESKQLLDESQPNPLIVKCPKNEKISTKSRTILWHMTFFGFVINYMGRSNLNMAIVSMVVPIRKVSNDTVMRSLECFNHSSDFVIANHSDDYHNGDEIKGRFRLERNVMDFFKV